MVSVVNIRYTIQNMEKTVEFVKSLTRGPCSCWYDSGLAGLIVGISSFATKGPRTVHCTRCQAREALEADGVEYVKDDTIKPYMFNSQLNGAAACCMPWTGMTVSSGTLHLQFKP